MVNYAVAVSVQSGCEVLCSRLVVEYDEVEQLVGDLFSFTLSAGSSPAFGMTPADIPDGLFRLSAPRLKIPRVLSRGAFLKV